MSSRAYPPILRSLDTTRTIRLLQRVLLGGPFTTPPGAVERAPGVKETEAGPSWESLVTGDEVIRRIEDATGILRRAHPDSDEAFVRALYLVLLGREPEPEGLSAGVQAQRSGRSRTSAILQVSSSEEFLRRLERAAHVEWTRAMTSWGGGDRALQLDAPERVQRNRDRARALVSLVGDRCGLSADSYFSLSVDRYADYVAAAMDFSAGSRVLDVGSAPGHVGIALLELGYVLDSVNLNADWRRLYPGPEWLGKLAVREHDIEGSPLPFPTASFDQVVFTEVLEHIVRRDPVEILRDLLRVLRPGGQLILSTPNVCNISNLFALMCGENVFWPREKFYGTLDRHNREWTPSEVLRALEEAGFVVEALYGFNCHSNWRLHAAQVAYDALDELGSEHPLLRNTTVALGRKPDSA